MPGSTVTSFLAGGAAGFGVDVALFPLDTIKTRLQSSKGFWKTGGFTGVYKGIGSAVAGSAPTSALFFATYETSKEVISSHAPTGYDPLVHCAAASIGEVSACLLRVPTENVKQKLQANVYKTTGECLRGIIGSSGPRGFFAGYWTTVLRDVPFSFIQFPLYEKAKRIWSESQGSPLQPWQGACCGSISGAFAGAVTTPLDVAKTRIMLGGDSKGVVYTHMGDTLKRVYAEGGVGALFSGLSPRVFWITIGGLIYFGVYEQAKVMLTANPEEE